MTRHARQQVTIKRRDQCNICEDRFQFENAQEKNLVRSNVRKFCTEKFEMWRCSSCRSLHSRQVVDLDRYYKDYPFQKIDNSPISRLLSKRFAKSLESFGITVNHKILDYGCGSGSLAMALRKFGYQVRAYDKYTPRFRDPSLLECEYDFIILQDVIEHVEEPGDLLMELSSILKPGGRIFIGTPNAEKISLENPEKFLHALHQPYHLHILSKTALKNLASKYEYKIGFESDIYYTDTFYPMLNVRFAQYYLNLFENNIEDVTDGFKFHWKLLMPQAILFALTGRLVPIKSQMSLVLEKIKKEAKETPSTYSKTVS